MTGWPRSWPGRRGSVPRLRVGMELREAQRWTRREAPFPPTGRAMPGPVPAAGMGVDGEDREGVSGGSPLPHHDPTQPGHNRLAWGGQQGPGGGELAAAPPHTTPPLAWQHPSAEWGHQVEAPRLREGAQGLTGKSGEG